MDDKQRLRNSLSDIEDAARFRRKCVERDGMDQADAVETLNLIARLAQIIREDIVQ